MLRGPALAGLTLAACTPQSGDYLLQTEHWSTQCTVGSGPYSVPANQYAIEVLVDDDQVWLDQHACSRDGFEYACDDDPLVTSLEGAGLDAVVSIRRAWTGAWANVETLTGTVVYTAHCEGADCFDVTAEGVELCGATWEYSAVAVEWD